MTPDDTPYLSDRSFVEAVRAIQAEHPAAAAAHEQMCLLYTGRVLAALLDRRPLIRPRPASSPH